MNKLSILILSASFLGDSFASTPKTLWLGQLTGNVQCLAEGERVSTLGAAIADLEERGVHVSEGKVGYVADRLFCQSCGCPEGRFNLAKVVATPSIEQLIEEGDWEMVQPLDKQSGHGDFRMMPGAPLDLQ